MEPKRIDSKLKKYRITVLSITGRPLTFHVASYEIVTGGFIQFRDDVTDTIKQFHSSRCEIEEVNSE